MSVSHYQFEALLGSGITGTVYLAINPQGERVAIKSMIKLHIPEISKDEARIMKNNPPHQNIVALLAKIEEQDVLHLVLEYVGRDNLMSYVNRTGAFSEPNARTLFQGMIAGLEHLHGNGIVHRDIKCENILLTSDLIPKICDLGFARKWKKNHLLYDFCGSFHYAAPEILSRKPYEGPEIDVWSIGVVLYAIVARQLPWDGTRDEMMDCILRGDYWSLDFFSPAFRELLDHVLQPVAHQRWTIAQIKNSELLRGEASYFLAHSGIPRSESNSSSISLGSWNASGRYSNRSLFSSKRSTGPEKIERSGRFSVKKKRRDPNTQTICETQNEEHEFEEVPEMNIVIEELTIPKAEIEQEASHTKLRRSEQEPSPAQLERESQDTLGGLELMLSKLESKEGNRLDPFGGGLMELGKTGKTTSVDLGEVGGWNEGKIFLSENPRKVAAKAKTKNPLRHLWEKALGGRLSPRFGRENSAPTSETKPLSRDSSFLDRFKNAQITRYDTS
eukprot:TRINITY_DN2253_c0_g1_i1.p1 TRINITY_DN2253_c0_g1~~TRINITY_DN2253_c0_g1_i1.p1  ORF type:complete len:512 (-),score=119.67 TRINITY_DN2253_c0_g1_i1:190-1698(-)